MQIAVRLEYIKNFIESKLNFKFTTANVEAGLHFTIEAYSLQNSTMCMFQITVKNNRTAEKLNSLKYYFHRQNLAKVMFGKHIIINTETGEHIELTLLNA